MQFVKMHGIGNDYIMIDDVEQKLDDELLSVLAREMSERHFGIGGDGIIVVRPSQVADFKMYMFNSDGSTGLMCGTGVRCLAKFVRDHGLTTAEKVDVETGSGVVEAWVLENELYEGTVRVNMGKPRFKRSDIPMHGRDVERVVDERVTAEGKDFFVIALSMGNPHCVVIVESLTDVDLETWGPALEQHPVFPDRTNVEFVQVEGISTVRSVVWERGSGATLACGSGACAVAVATATKGMTARSMTVIMPGGELQVNWDDDDYVWLTGPCTRVFAGEYYRTT